MVLVNRDEAVGMEVVGEQAAGVEWGEVGVAIGARHASVYGLRWRL